jgi:hypothetical protein
VNSRTGLPRVPTDVSKAPSGDSSYVLNRQVVGDYRCSFSRNGGWLIDVDFQTVNSSPFPWQGMRALIDELNGRDSLKKNLAPRNSKRDRTLSCGYLLNPQGIHEASTNYTRPYFPPQADQLINNLHQRYKSWLPGRLSSLKLPCLEVNFSSSVYQT